MRASAFPFHLFAQAPAALDGQDRPPLSSNKDTRMDETALRRAEKMKRIKAARDAMMATKTKERGLDIVHTGAGKGKSSSGFGMILRCIAWGMPCGVVQFVKGT
jgi:hypothetical protein